MSESRTVHEAILQAAEEEFLEKGFQNASLRNIVKIAGVTTGAFYRYYSSKDALFAALVEPHAAQVKYLFLSDIERWDALASEDKLKHMTDISKPCIGAILDYIYDHYTGFKLLVCASGGTVYENFIHDLVVEEVASSFRCAEVLREMGYDVPEMDPELCHLLSSAMFSGIFEIVAHDMNKEDAKRRVAQLQEFFTGGWCRLMNYEFK